MENLIFAIIMLLIGSYLYYEFLKAGLLSRIMIWGAFIGVLGFCFGLSGENKINDISVLNTITIFICAFSLEENTTSLMRKLKAYKQKKKNRKEKSNKTNRDIFTGTDS